MMNASGSVAGFVVSIGISQVYPFQMAVVSIMDLTAGNSAEECCIQYA